MDPKKLRAVLQSLGLPTSGAPAKLQARALAVVAGLEQGLVPAEAVKAAGKLR